MNQNILSWRGPTRMTAVQLLDPRTTSGCQTPSEGRDLFSDNEEEGEQEQGAGCFEVKSNLGRCLLHIIQKYWSMKLPSSFKILSFFPCTSRWIPAFHLSPSKRASPHLTQPSPLKRHSQEHLTFPLPFLGLMRQTCIPSFHLEQANTHLPTQPHTCT